MLAAVSIAEAGKSCRHFQRRFASRSVRLRPGMPFAFPSESAFSFAGSALPYRIYCDGFAHGETALRVEEALRRTLDALKFETTEMLSVVGL
jgi:hypothetical protein